MVTKYRLNSERWQAVVGAAIGSGNFQGAVGAENEAQYFKRLEDRDDCVQRNYYGKRG